MVWHLENKKSILVWVLFFVLISHPLSAMRRVAKRCVVQSDEENSFLRGSESPSKILRTNSYDYMDQKDQPYTLYDQDGRCLSVEYDEDDSHSLRVIVEWFDDDTCCRQEGLLADDKEAIVQEKGPRSAKRCEWLCNSSGDEFYFLPTAAIEKYSPRPPPLPPSSIDKEYDFFDCANIFQLPAAACDLKQSNNDTSSDSSTDLSSDSDVEYSLDLSWHENKDRDGYTAEFIVAKRKKKTNSE